MTQRNAVCLDRESEFRLQELFFSTTNRQGVISFGNEVFTRVSGYDLDELVGKPHSVIRHPDMPRSVFRLFWNVLGDGDTIAAYVKNRSKDGSYYWVMAVAAPVTNDDLVTNHALGSDDDPASNRGPTSNGYLSVRLKPSSELLATVEGVYASVLADEQSAAADGMSKDEVAEIGLVSLLQKINQLGFPDYPSFMRHALATEMMSRHDTLGAGASAHQHKVRNQADSIFCAVDTLADANRRCDRLLGKMLSQLTSLRYANETFVSINDSLMVLSETIGTVAMNARVIADTPPIQAVSQALAEAESGNREAIAAMNDAVRALGLSLEQLAFDASVAALQGEIASHFLREMQIADDEGARQSVHHVQMLLSESKKRLQVLFERMHRTDQRFGDLSGITERLRRNAKSIRFVRIAGVKESAHLSAGHKFRGLFDGVKKHIIETIDHCGELRSHVQQARKSIAVVNEAKNSVSKEADLIEEAGRQLKLQAAL